ncbi:uncharacterized protein N7529_009993 [Penicillium soppii]|uniref:uncharacterized protein n=1 Tax=Penicillium soppii TaxID=69789 RepID=UPI002546FC5A|nr:uncharacterized protein N7529_009993 [Penicillium soppii]KAJ5856049.1 hypothetical protein N7529_009993 [Penicillium soppii]
MPLRLGILGANAAIQKTYLPVLLTLKTHYTLSAIYDPNPELANQCQSTFNIPHNLPITEILNHKEVDLILNLLPMEYHEQYTVTALKAGKHVMVEVPLTMSIPSLRRIREAIKQAQEQHPATAPKVVVGCARRYAPCFTDVFKKELADLGRIYYARCRHIAGPMNTGGKPAVHNDPEQFTALLEDVFGDDITPNRIAFCRYLGMLGCHDLSVMRESLGFPDAVSSVAITDPFYSAVFHYTNDSSGHPFTLLYEAGVDSVPRCDAHLTVYGARKTVSVQYDFPRPGEKISTGTFVKVVVEEAEVEENGAGGVRRVKRTETVSTCEEAYEREFLALHSHLVGGEAKTTADDAVMDLRLLLMVFEHYNRQCGTISTPLG